MPPCHLFERSKNKTLEKLTQTTGVVDSLNFNISIIKFFSYRSRDISIMFSSSKLYIWVFTGLLAVTTVFLNVYMFMMSLVSVKQKKQSPTDTIIIALSVANVAHQLVCYVWMTMSMVDSQCLISFLPYTVILVIIFSLKFIITWDTSFLTFYYSTKLVSTPNACYTQIQDIILKNVTLAVILIPLCAFGTCMPMVDVFDPANHTIVKLCSVLMPTSYNGQAYVALYVIIADVVPGLIMAKCCISISVHLIIHLRHMKFSTNGAHSPKLGSQMRVVQMSLCLVAIFSIYLAGDLYVLYMLAVNNKNTLNLMYFFTSIYTTTAAMVLILGKKTHWKTLIHDFNVFLDEYPCLSCLKVPEEKAKHSTPAKVKK